MTAGERTQAGVGVEARRQGDTFVATQILAKHNEKYMPREVIDSLKEQGVYEDPNS